MANYVSNYMFCTKEAKDKLLDWNGNYRHEMAGCYPETEVSLGDDKFLVIFSTRGMDYKAELLTKFILEFKDSYVYCVEENEIEEGYFFWNGAEVELKMRSLAQTIDGNEILIQHTDKECRPVITIFFSEKEMVIEHILKNERYRHDFSVESEKIIMSTIKEMLSDINKERADYYLPDKQDIDRRFIINWGNKTVWTETYTNEELTVQKDRYDIELEDGEWLYKGLIETLEEAMTTDGKSMKLDFRNWGDILDE